MAVAEEAAITLPQYQDLPDRGRPDLLAELVEALTEAVAHVQGAIAVDPIPITRLLRSALDALPAAEAHLTCHPAPVGLGAWRHELRTHAAAVAGWASLLSQTPSPETHARALSAIERNARAMTRLLARPSARQKPDAMTPEPRPERAASRRRPRSVPAASAPRPQAARRSAGARLDGLDLVVVEDDRDTRELLRQMLRWLGARVRLAEDASSGLVLLEQVRPDLILLDLMLPGMDGLTFAAHVRSDPRWRTVPILAVTALGGLADYIQTWTHGFAGHLTKPVDQEELARAIQQLAGRGRVASRKSS